MAWYEHEIQETPGVCGGYPRVRGTRVPVRLIIGALRQGATFDEMAEWWPHVTPAQFQAAIAYYLNAPARVDEDTRTNREAEGRIQEGSASPEAQAATSWLAGNSMVTRGEGKRWGWQA